MIEIRITKKQNVIDSIIIKGHSNYDKFGRDIVCASVSSISITTVNALLSIDEDCIKYTNDDGLLKIIVNKHSDVIDKLLDNMINLLTELTEKYKKNVIIR